MSTRGFVGVLNEDNSVNYIYNHFDSYFDGVGSELLKNFNNDEKAISLISRGSSSWVADEERYGEGPFPADNEEDFLNKMNKDCCIEFSYLWKDGKWYGAESDYFRHIDDGKHFYNFTPLTEILEAITS